LEKTDRDIIKEYTQSVDHIDDNAATEYENAASRPRRLLSPSARIQRL